VLQWIHIPRAFSVERRIAESLLLVDRNEQANADIKGFIASCNPKELPPTKLRSSAVPSPSNLSGLRSAPRIAPSPAAFALQQADLRHPGQRFSGAPSRPAGWVANGSLRPTSHTRMPPLELPAPLPHDHPAARAHSAQVAASEAATAATASKAAAGDLRATLLARAAFKKPRSSPSGIRASALPAGGLAATTRSQWSRTTLPSPRPYQSARTPSSAQRRAAPPPTAASKPPVGAPRRPSCLSSAAAMPSVAASIPPAAAALLPLLHVMLQRHRLPRKLHRLCQRRLLRPVHQVLHRQCLPRRLHRLWYRRLLSVLHHKLHRHLLPRQPNRLRQGHVLPPLWHVVKRHHLPQRVHRQQQRPLLRLLHKKLPRRHQPRFLKSRRQRRRLLLGRRDLEELNHVLCRRRLSTPAHHFRWDAGQLLMGPRPWKSCILALLLPPRLHCSRLLCQTCHLVQEALPLHQMPLHR